MLIDIFKKITNGIINIFKSKLLLIGFGIILALIIISFFTMKPGINKVVVIFLSIPTYLFFVGGFKPQNNKIIEIENNNQYYEDEDETPIIDRLERTKTTTTTETIYFKKGVKYLE